MRHLPFAFALVCVGHEAVAQATQETLAEAVNAALESNPTLLGQRQTRGVADAQLVQARAAGRPSLSLRSTYGYQNTEVGQKFNLFGSTFPQDGNSENASAGLELGQTFYAGGSLGAQRRAAQAGVRASESQLVAVQRDTILDAVAAFVDVRRAEEEIIIRETNVDSLRKQVQAAKDRFQVGEVTRTDVAQAEARAALSLADLAAARSRLASARAVYVQIIGHVPTQLAPPPPPPPEPGAIEDAIAEAMKRNPDVRAAREFEAVTREQVGVSRGDYMPRLGWTAGANLQETYRDDTFRDTSVTAAVQLTVPIYQGGLLAARTREARLNAERARYDRLAAERQVTAQVTSAWHALIATREAIVASQSREDAAQIALEGAQQELAVGTRTTLDVLDQEREFLDARLGLIDAQRNAYLASYQLLGAIGRLTTEILPR